MKKISLAQMKAGQKARIHEICGGQALKGKLLSMGIFPGREITKLSHFALRGPVAVRVGRTVLAIGHTMAVKVIAEME